MVGSSLSLKMAFYCLGLFQGFGCLAIKCICNCLTSNSTLNRSQPFLGLYVIYSN